MSFLRGRFPSAPIAAHWSDCRTHSVFESCRTVGTGSYRPAGLSQFRLWHVDAVSRAAARRRPSALTLGSSRIGASVVSAAIPKVCIPQLRPSASLAVTPESARREDKWHREWRWVTEDRLRLGLEVRRRACRAGTGSGSGHQSPDASREEQPHHALCHGGRVRHARRKSLCCWR